MGELEDLVRELTQAKRRIREKQEAVDAAKVGLMQARKELNDAIRAKEEIEDEITDPGARRPPLAAAEAAATPTPPRPGPDRDDPRTTYHFVVYRDWSGQKGASGLRVGSQVAHDPEEALRLASQSWMGPLRIGERIPHGTNCGCGEQLLERIRAGEAEPVLQSMSSPAGLAHRKKAKRARGGRAPATTDKE